MSDGCGCHDYPHSLPRDFIHNAACQERRRTETVVMPRSIHASIARRGEWHSNGERWSRWSSNARGSH